MSWPVIAQVAPATQTTGQQSPTPLRDAAAELYIYPKNGQTLEQQWSDRYACHAWAKDQSGFDPTRQGMGTTPEQTTAHREQYRRAMTACLDAHGYSVTDAPSPAVQPPAPLKPAPPPHTQAMPVRYSQSGPTLRYHPLAIQIEGGYTLAEGDAGRALDNGWNTGLGLTWFPTSVLPLGLRVDGTYSRFEETDQSLRLASLSTGTNVTFGHEDLYGGDLDLQLDLRMGPGMKEYFFGGVGRYREQTTFKQVSYQYGVGCFYYCFPGYFPAVATVERNTSDWLSSWNAGMGFEFALEEPASFFIEARYLHLSAAGSRAEFVPIRVGLRF
jgi:opacity protein-like surface antigen